MTTPAQDRDQRAALSAARSAEPSPSPETDLLWEAAREALRLLRRAGHAPTRAEDPAGEPYCCICDEDWPCEVEQARRRLAAALNTHDQKEDR